MTPETLKRIEWCILDARDMPRQCPVCYSVREKGHAPGCELKADLDASSGERPEIQVGDWVSDIEAPDVPYAVRKVEQAAECSGRLSRFVAEIRQANGRIWRRGGATS